MAVWSGMPDAAVKFRGRVFQSEYHSDALKDCIECPEWPESHTEIERIIDEEIEPIEFGRMNGPLGGYRPLAGMDAQVRKEWYLYDR